MPLLRYNLPPPPQRELAPPAPHLTIDNLCSACGVRPLSIANGKVCPNCYSMLWHDGNQAAVEDAQKRLVLRQEAAARSAIAREARRQSRRELAEAAYQRAQQIIREPQS